MNGLSVYVRVVAMFRRARNMFSPSVWGRFFKRITFVVHIESIYTDALMLSEQCYTLVSYFLALLNFSDLVYFAGRKLALSLHT